MEAKDNGIEEQQQLVDLSLSGTSFTVRRKLLTEHEWMLSKLLNGKIPWALHHNGRYFIDADPTSFRWVLHFARYRSLPTEILHSMKELEAIVDLADFLCFNSMLEYVNDNMAKCLQIQSTVQELEERIAVLTQAQEDEVSALKKAHEDEVSGLKLAHQEEYRELQRVHENEIEPLSSLKTKVDGMDGMKFAQLNYGTFCEVLALWSPENDHLDHSNVKCPRCGKLAAEHRHKHKLFGKRSNVNSSTMINDKPFSQQDKAKSSVPFVGLCGLGY